MIMVDGPALSLLIWTCWLPAGGTCHTWHYINNIIPFVEENNWWKSLDTASNQQI